jgi:hypothetical protein
MVGYDLDKDTVYGKDERENGRLVARYADAMTLHQAVRKLRHLESDVAKCIYKLVPVTAAQLRRKRKVVA